MSAMNDLIPVEPDDSSDPIEPFPVRGDAPSSWTQELSIGNIRPAKTEMPGPIWHVPLNRGVNFTGRDAILDELHKLLRSEKSISRTQALVGMAGVGKTQIALEYAYRHRDKYAVVWWIRADNETTLAHDYSILARELFPGTQDRHSDATRQAVNRELQKREGWLLIFDGTADPNSIAACIPSKHHGHVIVTSRNPNCSCRGAPNPLCTVPSKLNNRFVVSG